MNHQQALAQHPSETTQCETPLVFVHDAFWGDVDWSLYHCPTCNAIIACVGGGRHGWNYTIREGHCLQCLALLVLEADERTIRP